MDKKEDLELLSQMELILKDMTHLQHELLALWTELTTPSYTLQDVGTERKTVTLPLFRNDGQIQDEHSNLSKKLALIVNDFELVSNEVSRLEQCVQKK